MSPRLHPLPVDISPDMGDVSSQKKAKAWCAVVSQSCRREGSDVGGATWALLALLGVRDAGMRGMPWRLLKLAAQP